MRSANWEGRMKQTGCGTTFYDLFTSSQLLKHVLFSFQILLDHDSTSNKEKADPVQAEAVSNSTSSPAATSKMVSAASSSKSEPQTKDGSNTSPTPPSSTIPVENSRFELSPVKTGAGKTATPLPAAGGKESRKEKRSKERKERREKRQRNRAASTSSFSEEPQAGGGLHCHYCGVTLLSQHEFQSHSRSEQHQQAVFSDQGRDWRHRPPPRGVGSESYATCAQFLSEGHCRFGSQCVEAHNEEELAEWKERFEYRKARAQRATKLFGKSFVEVVLDKLAAAKGQVERVVTPRIVGIACDCSNRLDVQVSRKNEALAWVFEIRAGPHLLQDVGLLNDANRRHFSLDYVKHSAADRGSSDSSLRTFSLPREDGDGGGNAQEWSHPCLNKYPGGSKKLDMTYRVKVAFRTDIFGTFRQSVIFHFSGLEQVRGRKSFFMEGKNLLTSCFQYLRRDLCVDLVPLPGGDDEDEEKPEESARKFRERIIKQPERYTQFLLEVSVVFKGLGLIPPPLTKPLNILEKESLSHSIINQNSKV